MHLLNLWRQCRKLFSIIWTDVCNDFIMIFANYILAYMSHSFLVKKSVIKIDLAFNNNILSLSVCVSLSKSHIFNCFIILLLCGFEMNSGCTPCLYSGFHFVMLRSSIDLRIILLFLLQTSVYLCLCSGLRNIHLILIISVHLTWSYFFYMLTSKIVLF